MNNNFLLKIFGDNVLEVVLAYQADKDGLPDSAAYQALLTEIMRISTLLCSQPNVFYAGYVLSSSEAKLHFYCGSAVLLRHFTSISIS